MSKWEMVKLSEITELITKGTTPTTIGFSFQDEGINFVKIESISENGEFILDKFDHISYECDEKLRRSRLQEYDILFSIAGALGRSAIVTKEILPANTNQALAIIRLKNSNVLPKYVQVSLKSNAIFKQFQKQKQGVAQLNLSLKNIGDLVIPLPPLETQKQIAKTLDTTAELLTIRKQQLAELNNLIKSIFYDMFGDPVMNKKGWKRALLGELLDDIRYGTSVPPVFSDEGYCFIRATNIKFGRIIDNDIKYISEEEAGKISKCRLQGGELIIVRSGVNTGDTCVITGKYVGQYAGYDLIITPNQKVINSIYLNELINTNYIEYIIKPLTRRAAQPHLNAEQIKKLPIILPSLKLQTRFTEIVTKIEEQKALVQKAIDETQYLFDGLMSEYFE